MTISLQDFIREHAGKEISGWSNSGGQCVDQVRRYMQEVFGVTTRTFDWIAAGNAHSFYDNANPAHFHKVRNTPSYVPPAGAIFVLNHGEFGHVGIVRPGTTVRLMYTFDQNWSVLRRCELEAHRYVELIGFLVKR